MLAGIVLAAALAATTPTYPLQQANDGRPPITEQQAQPKQIAAHAQNSPQSPLYVKAECDKGCDYSEDDKGWWQKLWTDPIAFFTAVLAGFTIWLAFATRTAANAAKTAADALPRLERSYIFLDVRQFKNVSDAARGIRVVATTPIYVLNPGRTPAIIKSAKSKVDVAATPDRLPETANNRSKQPIEWIIAPNTSERPDDGDYSRSFYAMQTEFTAGHDVRDENRLTPAQLDRIQAGEFLWVWAQVIYDDVFGAEHKTGILFRIDRLGTVEIHGGKKWNYRT